MVINTNFTGLHGQKNIKFWTVLVQLNNPQRMPLWILFATLCSTQFRRRGQREQTSDGSPQVRRLNCSVRPKAFVETKFCTWLTIHCSVYWALGLYTFWQIITAIFSSQMNLTMRFWGSHGAKEAIEMKLFLLALIQWWNTYKSNPLLQSRFIARRGKWGTWKDQNNDRKKRMAEILHSLPTTASLAEQNTADLWPQSPTLCYSPKHNLHVQSRCVSLASGTSVNRNPMSVILVVAYYICNWTFAISVLMVGTNVCSDPSVLSEVFDRARLVTNRLKHLFSDCPWFRPRFLARNYCLILSSALPRFPHDGESWKFLVGIFRKMCTGSTTLFKIT